jgi:cytochrome c-type biogenesis protein CcmH
MPRLPTVLAAMAIALCLTALPAEAVQPDEVLDDPALEARARAISLGLRCLVCQNQSIDDSDAPLAKDLRVLVRERLKEGDTDQEIEDFVVARYGEFVLLKPRLEWRTVLLWGVPPGMLAIGAAALFWLWRRREVPSEPAALDAAEQRKLDDYLRRDEA